MTNRVSVSAEGVYPQWKIIAWRFARTFLATFFGCLALNLENLETYQVNFLQTLILPAIAGASVALFKALRDQFAERFSFLDKIPF